LTADLFKSTKAGGDHPDGVTLLERAFTMVVSAQPIRDKMRTAHVRDADQALKQGTITAGEAAQLKATADAVSAAVAVNDFAPEELTSRDAGHERERPFQATSHQPAAE
jgi:acyl-CoA dehydrogenase